MSNAVVAVLQKNQLLREEEVVVVAAVGEEAV